MWSAKTKERLCKVKEVRPDLYDRVLSGELSPSRSMELAGIVPLRISVTVQKDPTDTAKLLIARTPSDVLSVVYEMLKARQQKC